MVNVDASIRPAVISLLHRGFTWKKIEEEFLQVEERRFDRQRDKEREQENRYQNAEIIHNMIERIVKDRPPDRSIVDLHEIQVDQVDTVRQSAQWTEGTPR